MSIAPYKRPPKPAPVALLTEDGRVAGEAGESWALGDVPKGVKVFADRVLGVAMAARGRGELVCWNELPIRWEWGSERGKSAYLSGLGFGVDPAFLRGLVAWRDWLAAYGAAAGSVSSAGSSLLRATLARPIGLGRGDAPPIADPIGGRQEGRPPGRYGDFEIWDIRAAYGRTIGECVYPAGWAHFEDRAAEIVRNLSGALPCFVRADVSRRTSAAPLTFGPLPRRYPYRPTPTITRKLTGGRDYPRSGRLRGIWCIEEIRAAESVGARVRVIEAWVMVGDNEAQPFLPWWHAIEAGRKRFGPNGRHRDPWAYALVKSTANALVGTLISDGERTRVRWVDGERESRPDDAPKRPPHLQAPDLYETITGRIRARLYTELEMASNDRLISVHTDGGLIECGSSRIEAPTGPFPTGNDPPPEMNPSLPLGDSLLKAPPARASDRSRRPGDFPPEPPPSPPFVPRATSRNGHVAPRDWRRKDRGVQLWYAGPQTYAYRRATGELVYRVSGVEPERAAEAFYATAAVVHAMGRQRPLQSFTAAQRLFRAVMRRFPTLTADEATADIDDWLDGATPEDVAETLGVLA